MAVIELSLPGFPAIVTHLDDTLPYENYGDYFGIKSDGITDDTLALKAAIEAISSSGKAPGGILRLRPGSVTITSDQTVLHPFVQLDLMGGALQANLASGNEPAIRPLSDSTLRNGKIDVRSSGSPGSQAGAHAPIFIGTFYGERDSAGQLYTVANINPFDDVSGVTLRDLSLISNKDLGTGATAGATAIQVCGNVWGCTIGRIRILASDKLQGGISLDWGVRGAIGDVEAIRSDHTQMAANRANFDNGVGFTSHPHDFDIFDIIVEALTRPYQGSADTGTFAFRVSGCHDIRARDILAYATTEAAFIHHAGDLGYEFARSELHGAPGTPFENVHGARRRALMGNRFRNLTVVDARTGNVVKSDAGADNILRAKQPPHNHVPTHADHVWQTDVLWSNVKGFTTAGPNAAYGINCFDQDGGRFEDCVIQGCLVGARFSGARNVADVRGHYIFSRQENVRIEDKCRNVSLIDMRECFYANRNRGGHSVVHVRASEGVTIEGGSYGAEAVDESGVHTILLELTAWGVTLKRPKINSHGAEGHAVVAASGEAWGVLGLVEGIEYGAFVTKRYAGATVVPVARRGGGGDGIERMTYVTADGGTNLAGFTMTRGDRIEYLNPSAGGRMGKACVATGTIGILNGGKTTGTIAANSRTLVVSSAAGLLRGQRLTIAGVAGAKTVTAVSGARVSLDSAANAGAINAAVAFQACVTKDYGPIDA